MNSHRPHTPETLPLKSLDWGRLVSFLGEAHSGVARFDALVKNIPEASLLLAPLTNKEAVLSSRIEGTQASLEDVLRFQAEGKAKGEKRDDILEVLNYREALLTSFDRMGQLPISACLIRDAHRILLSGVRGKRKDPGNFRSGEVYIGGPGISRNEARYIPPEAQLVPELFSNLEQYIHHEEKDVLVQLAVVHAQFEIIHPFWDGNGRVGRLLMPLFLYYKEAISTPYFYLSEYLEKHRDEYYDGLHRVTKNGDWEQWIEFFLHAIAGQSRLNADKTLKIINLKDEILLRIQKVTHSQYIPQMTNFIFSKPLFTSIQFRDEATVPRPSATRLLGLLEGGGIIQKMVPARGSRPALYHFPELVRMLR